MHKRLEVQGHRGMRGHYPENTMAGFVAALEAGVDVIECDVLSTSDGILIIHHDYVCHEFLVLSLSLSEIKRFDVGRPNPVYPCQKAILGAHIPALKELLELLQIYPQSRLNLEIKRDVRHPEWTLDPKELAKKIVDQVKQSGFSDRIYYSSFDLEVLSEIRKIDLKAEIGVVCELQDIPSSLLESAKTLEATIFSPEHPSLKNKMQVQMLQKMGFRVIPWTVNDPERWKELIEMGVDGIITDFPKELIEYNSHR